jgi:hypothetical protein
MPSQPLKSTTVPATFAMAAPKRGGWGPETFSSLQTAPFQVHVSPSPVVPL